MDDLKRVAHRLQEDRVLTILENGQTITTLAGREELRINELPGRIFGLRKRVYTINRRMVWVISNSGYRSMMAEYSLVTEAA